MANLLLTLLDKSGIREDSIGDSTGELINTRPYSLLASSLAIGSWLSAWAGTMKVADQGGDTATLALLKQHADVNAPEADGTTALHWAARQDDLDMADRLIKAGANVKAANRYGVTPLYLACVNGKRADDRETLGRRRRRKLRHYRR